MANNRYGKVVDRQRLGIASIEFLLFIPIFLGFALFIAWSFRVQTAILQAGIDADAKTALDATILVEKSQFGLTDTLAIGHTRELTQLLHAFQPRLNVGEGVVEDVAHRETGAGYKGIARPIGDAIDGHIMMAHAWESDVLSFPTTKRDQPPLTLPAAIRGIAPSWTELNAFSNLTRIEVDPRAKSENAKLASDLQKDLSQSLRDSQAALKEVEENIDAVKQAIERETSRNPVDYVKLGSLRAELTKQEYYRTQLQNAIQQAARAQKIAQQTAPVTD